MLFFGYILLHIFMCGRHESMENTENMEEITGMITITMQSISTGTRRKGFRTLEGTRMHISMSTVRRNSNERYSSMRHMDPSYHQLVDLYRLCLQLHQSQDFLALALPWRICGIYSCTVHRNVRFSSDHLSALRLAGKSLLLCQSRAAGSKEFVANRTYTYSILQYSIKLLCYYSAKIRRRSKI